MLLAQGWQESEILRNYPSTTHEDITACLKYATNLLKEEGSLLKSSAQYPIWFPYNSYETAETLLNLLKKKSLHTHPAFGSWRKHNTGALNYQSKMCSEWEEDV